MNALKKSLRSVLPTLFLSFYHFVLAYLAALLYGFPSSKITVIAVTGTKGKSSTLEYLNAIAESAGIQTALSSTIRFKIGDVSTPNTRRMTIPGRFFLQKFLSQAVAAKCTIAFIELTSEGARQYRHRALHLDALIFLNLAPEHIESHGSYEAYANAKLELGKQLARSRKRPRYMVVNGEDKEASRFLMLPVENVIPFALHTIPFDTSENGGHITFDGLPITVRFPGEFSCANALAAATLMFAIGTPSTTIARGIESLTRIPGRAEEIHEGQSFPVIVDYAHTPDSMRALYSAFPSRRKICVFGSTGGGRDLWKRPVMGSIADEFCEAIILTNEDSYDEEPRSIVESIREGITRHTPEIIIDRREAIRRALTIARSSDVVLVTGKGTDPTIQGPRGTSIPWSDAMVVTEELQKLMKS